MNLFIFLFHLHIVPKSSKHLNTAECIIRRQKEKKIGFMKQRYLKKGDFYLTVSYGKGGTMKIFMYVKPVVTIFPGHMTETSIGLRA